MGSLLEECKYLCAIDSETAPAPPEYTPKSPRPGVALFCHTGYKILGQVNFASLGLKSLICTVGINISVRQECLRPKEDNTQCASTLSEVEPWPTQAIGTNCFPVPGFSPLETRLCLPTPPPSGRGLPDVGACLGGDSGFWSGTPETRLRSPSPRPHPGTPHLHRLIPTDEEAANQGSRM